MKITTNGEYLLSPKEGKGGGTIVVLLSGVSGGASVQTGYFDDDVSWVPLEDGYLIINNQYRIYAGEGRGIYARVSGASESTQLSLMASGKA